MKIRSFLPFVPLALLVAGCGSKGGGGSAASGDDVAIVNNEPVTLAEFNDYLPRKSTVQVVTPQGPVEAQIAGSFGLQAMRDLVNKKLLLQLAKDEGVMPNGTDIQAELDFQQKRDPNFVKRLTGAGLTLEQIKNDLEVALAREKVLTKGITVTPKEVDDYIAKNPKAFVTPARVQLAWILLTDKRNQSAVDQDLKGGSSFGQVAARYSEAPNARTTGGAYPVSNLADLPPKLKDLVDKLKEGGTTDWVQDNANLVKFFLQSRSPETKLKIDDGVKESVRRLIAEQRGGQARDLNQTLTDRLRKANVDVRIGWLRDPWKQAIDGLKQTADRNAGQSQPTGQTPPAGQ